MSAVSRPSPRPADALGRLRARVLPVVVSVAYWVLLPVVALLTLALSLESFAVHINGAPAGKVGTYLVTYHGCPNSLCITGGTFTSDDGTVVETSIIGQSTWRLGQTYRALSAFPYDSAAPVPGRWDPTQAIVGTAGSLVVLGGWGWLALDMRRRRGAPATVRATPAAG